MRRSPSRPLRHSALRNKGRQARFVVDEIDAGQALNRGRSPTRQGARAGGADVGRAASPGGDGDAGGQRVGREHWRQRRTPRGRRRGGSGSSAAPSQPPAAPAGGRDSSRTRADEGGVAPNRTRDTFATADDNHSRVSAEHRHRLGPTRATPVAGTTCLVRLRRQRCLEQARGRATRAASQLAGPRCRKARARGSPKEKAKARVRGQPTPAVRRMGTGCRAKAGAHVAITRRGIDES